MTMIWTKCGEVKRQYGGISSSLSRQFMRKQSIIGTRNLRDVNLVMLPCALPRGSALSVVGLPCPSVPSRNRKAV